MTDRALKLIPLPITADLSRVSLEQAAELAVAELHDGWADLVVHQSQLRPAIQLASAYNADTRELQIRVLTDTTLGHDDWKLRTRTAVVTSYWTHRI